MSAGIPVPPSTPEEYMALYEAKIRAELASADRVAPGSDVIPCRGDLFAAVMLVKGDPGPAEVAGGSALSGPDGEAAAKALEALGFDPSAVFATVARPEAGIEPPLLAQRLRLQVEAVDPQFVVALDSSAAELLAAAFACDRLAPGKASAVLGRAMLALDGLEASLVDERAKKRVWRQFRALTPRGPSL